MKYPKGVIKGNEIVKQDENITELKYSNCNETFTVNTNKLPIVQKTTWHKGSNGYAMGTNMESRKMTKLHRILLEEELNKQENEGMVVDHIDRNKNNNTLENLRIVPVRINDLNSQQAIDSEIQINGVRKDCGKYITRIVFDGKRYSLGSYNNQYDAGLVYDSYLYNKCPESEWDSMNIKQGKIPEDVLEKYNIDPNDPSTLPKIPSSKQGNNKYNGVSIGNNKYRYCSTYIRNEDRKQIDLSKSGKISELEGVVIRELYLLEHPELLEFNIPNVIWPKETDGKTNIVGIIVDRDEYELKTRGY